MQSVTLLDALFKGIAGVRAGVAIEPGDWPANERHLHTRTTHTVDNDTLASWLRQWDARGWNVYHACALFSEPRRRAQFALGARAFWIDLDVGPGKSFATQEQAARATFAFVNHLRIPMPSFVSSGRGVHCYWILDRFLDPATWMNYAARLKQACAQLGFPADPSRTADIASILRTPGTHNHKDNPPSLVRELLMQPRTVTLAELQPLTVFEPTHRVPVFVGTDRPLIAAATNIYSYDPPDPDAVADGCAQVRLLRDWRTTHAPVPEPVWRGILGALKHCEEGIEVAHEWSDGHNAYDEAATDAKIDGWKTGPTTCAYFAEHNAAGCAGCPHAGKITSPVQLGRDREVKSQPVPFVPAPLVGPANNPALPLMPPNYSIRGDGALVAIVEDIKKNGGGSAREIVLSRSTLYLDRIARGELRNDRHFYVFKHVTPHDGEVTIEIPAKDFWGSQGLATLAGKGPVVEEADHFRKYMRDAVNLQQSTRKTGMMYEQCGWKENDTAFLVGTTLYRAGSSHSVQGTPEIVYRGTRLGPRPGGDLAKWKLAADQLFGTGREAQSFALLASFGAPLIRFLSGDEGGAIISLVSRGSGRGKTTALAGVTSVWGEIRGLQLANADTAVARGLTFGALGNLPVVFDELAAREPEVLRDFIEMFTNGRDKMRGTQDGEIKHTLASWQTILITASNTSLIDAVTSQGGSIATTLRVIELPVTLPPDATREGDQYKEMLHKNWGYAGDAFVRYLLNPNILAWARGMVVQSAQSLIKQHNFQPEHRFWVRTLACCATAGLIANHLGLITFPVGSILAWTVEQLRARALSTTQYMPKTTETGDYETAVDVLVDFINEHISEMLVCADSFENGRTQTPRVTPRNRLTLRYNIRPAEMFISERELRSYLVKREFGFFDFMRELIKKGITGKDRKYVNLGGGTDFTSGSQRCVQVNVSHPQLAGAAGDIKSIVDAPKTIISNVVPLR